MAMSNAERQRLYRQKRDRDPKRRQEYLNKEKEKYKQDKATGRKKTVKNMTEREKRSARKYWRLKKRKNRATMKGLEKMLLTPPDSPGSLNNPQISRQKKQSAKKKNKESAKCYRENKKLKQELTKQKRITEMYRKGAKD